ncbi:unnamed protein product [Lymnaea stagnalis]|uniref:Uncharacterized protein n=1 Tax=Lymnaea stagnalis TaxID=6523 RepID=A0AAV2I7H8_LYMST
MKEYLFETTENKLSKNMTLRRSKLTKILKIGGAICIISAILIVVAALTLLPGKSKLLLKHLPQLALKSGNVAFDESSQTLLFTDRESSKHYLSIVVPKKQSSKRCKDFIDGKTSQNEDGSDATYGKNEDLFSARNPEICLLFSNGLNLAVYEDNLEGLQCHIVHWVSPNKEADITNCVDITNDNWYGGGGLSVQRWPINRVNVSLQPYLTKKFKFSKTESDNGASFDSFIEPYFISASGTVIMLDSNLPLFISMNFNNDKKICFNSAYKKPYYSHESNDQVILKYKVCKDKLGKTAHRHFLDAKALEHSTVSPPVTMLLKPIWSTRGINLDDIDQSTVLSFVKNIKSNKLPYSQLFIDGNYIRSSGYFYFNENKFPNSHQMIMEFDSDPSSDKLPVGMEVYPYLPSSKEFETFAVVYKNKENSVVQMKQPLYLDVTSDNGVSWYASQLKEVSKELSITGFRFSGGHAFDLLGNRDLSLLAFNKTMHPNMFTKLYAEIASDFGDRCLQGSGFKSQTHTSVADAGPMMSTWEHAKGLKSIIPTTLTYGLMGYPFVLTGPIGGVNTADQTPGDFLPPDKELYIRWLQIAIFLPVMELSYGPWVYGEEVVNYTRTLLEYRRTVLWPKYLSGAVKEATDVGTPIARPLWFVSPWDKVAQFIDCEFFLSNSLLVAPVMFPNARHRDVYLPEGFWWKDQLRGQYYSGGQWLRSFEVGLYEIATFIQERPPK